MKFLSKTENDTKLFAQEIAASLKAGDVLALDGELGSGKTTFTRFLAEALKVKDYVNSPTFVIMKVYKAKSDKIKELVHIDAYRLTDQKDLVDIGAIEYFDSPQTVTVIEWAERINQILPPRTQYFKFEHAKEGRLINYFYGKNRKTRSKPTAK